MGLIYPTSILAIRTERSNVTASGHTGRKDRFCSVDMVAPVGNDQICYVKDSNGWKIGGYIGGGDSRQ